MSVTDRIICSVCNSNNMPGQTICWKCKSQLSHPMNAKYTPIKNDIGVPSLRKRLIALGILFPIIGVIAGLYFYTKDAPEDRSNGRFVMLWSAIGFIGTWFLYMTFFNPLTESFYKSIATKSSENTNVLVLLDCEVEYSKYPMQNGYQALIHGELQNVSSNSYNAVIVTAHFYQGDQEFATRKIILTNLFYGTSQVFNFATALNDIQGVNVKLEFTTPDGDELKYKRL